MNYIEIKFFNFYNFGINFFLVMKVNVEDYDVIMGQDLLVVSLDSLFKLDDLQINVNYNSLSFNEQGCG